MCETCGCGESGSFQIRKPGEAEPVWPEAEHSHIHRHNQDHSHDHPHVHSGGHDHNHSHEHDHHIKNTNPVSFSGRRLLNLDQDILEVNKAMARHNRAFFEEKKIFCLNLVSSPGSGKTTLLERIIALLKERTPVFVVEGDQQSMLDSDRLAKLGIPVVQINTGSGCHLDAHMVNRAIQTLDLISGSLLFIENVGNLVCPALFDLGESARILIMSVTEGEDKPLKYPAMFRSAQLCVINKTDLLPYVDFNVETAVKNASAMNPGLEFLEVSAKTGMGLEPLIEWIISRHNKKNN